MSELIRQHGWHVIAELAVLALVSVFTLVYVVALLRGRVRAVRCACGRLVSRDNTRCPRCGSTLRPSGAPPEDRVLEHRP